MGMLENLVELPHAGEPVIGVLSVPTLMSVSPRLTPAQRMRWEHESAEHVELQRWHRGVLAQAVAHAKVRAAVAERKRREDVFALALEPIISAELEAAHAARWPDDITRSVYAAAAKAFAIWAGELGVGYLPAQGMTVATWLLERSAEDGATLADIRQAARAIIFTHEIAQHYLDHTPISAMLAWIAKRYAQDQQQDQRQKELSQKELSQKDLSNDDQRGDQPPAVHDGPGTAGVQ
jgi:hypothetical protein